MKSTIEHEPWVSRGHLAQMYDQNLGDAVSNLRARLEPLPDQQIPAATAGLLFVPDQPLRESIRADIAFANHAFNGAESKAAMVLAGSAAEALLRWAITAKI
jgi:hypothetical protein